MLLVSRTTENESIMLFKIYSNSDKCFNEAIATTDDKILQGPSLNISGTVKANRFVHIHRQQA